MISKITQRIQSNLNNLESNAGKFSILTNILIFTFLFIVVGIVLWSLKRGLLFHDEAFYLLHLKDIEIFSTSYWYLLARAFYPQDIIQIRWLTISLILIAHVVFVAGFSYYLKNKIEVRIHHFFILLALSITGQFVLWMPVQFVPSYWTFNYISILCSLGFLMISYSSGNNLISHFFSFISGSFIGWILFIMLTNIPLIVVMVFVSYLHFRQRNKDFIFYHFIFFLAGILATITIYFLLIQNLQDFLYNFRTSIEHLSHDNTHGIIPMLIWIVKSIQYLTVEIMLLVIAFIFSDLFLSKTTHFRLKLFVDFIIILAIIFLTINGVMLTNEVGIFSPSLILVLFFVLLYKNIHSLVIDLKFSALLIALVLMPFIASLGTNVPFELRGVAYISVVFVSIYIFLLFLKDIRYKIVFSVFLFIITINFIRLPFISGWTYQKQIEQTQPVKVLGIDQTILLDSERYGNLEKLKEIVPPNSTVLVSHRSFWGYVYLLDWNIPYLYFDFSENLFMEHIKLHATNLDNYAFIELKTIPFPNGFFDRLTDFGLNKEHLQNITVNDDITVYKIRN
jgi:hypothetical protein